jgi:hypothetical protein
MIDFTDIVKGVKPSAVFLVRLAEGNLLPDIAIEFVDQFEGVDLSAWSLILNWAHPGRMRAGIDDARLDAELVSLLVKAGYLKKIEGS